MGCRASASIDVATRDSLTTAPGTLAGDCVRDVMLATRKAMAAAARHSVAAIHALPPTPTCLISHSSAASTPATAPNVFQP
jgi:hypothetical protein